MIVRPRPTAWQLFFVLRGSIVRHIRDKLLIVAGISLLALLIERSGWPAGVAATHVSMVPFSLLGLALSVFLGFRNNVCYDRWWEARKQWGDLLRASRTLSRETLAALPDETALTTRLLRSCIGFAHALAARLRDEDGAAAAAPWVPEADRPALAAARNANNHLAGRMATDLADAHRRGALGDIVYQALMNHLNVCASTQAACERLKVTPTPFAYSLLLHRTAWFFCLLLPFGLVGSAGWLTPLVVVIVAYTFFGLDALGDELEEPFGRADNDLPLDALVRTIEIDLLEMLGVQPLPEPLLPQDYVLT